MRWKAEVQSINTIVIVDEFDNEIAEIVADNDNDLLTQKEWDTANFIATAPEMKEVLEYCKKAFETITVLNTKPMVARIDKVLNKVESK